MRDVKLRCLRQAQEDTLRRTGFVTKNSFIDAPNLDCLSDSPPEGGGIGSAPASLSGCRGRGLLTSSDESGAEDPSAGSACSRGASPGRSRGAARPLSPEANGLGEGDWTPRTASPSWSGRCRGSWDHSFHLSACSWDDGKREGDSHSRTASPTSTKANTIDFTNFTNFTTASRSTGSELDVGSEVAPEEHPEAMQDLRRSILHHCAFLRIQGSSYRARRRARKAKYEFAGSLMIFVKGLPLERKTCWLNPLFHSVASVLMRYGFRAEARADSLYVTDATRTCVVRVDFAPSPAVLD